MLDLEAESDGSVELDFGEDQLIFKDVPRKLSKPPLSMANKQALEMLDLKENSSVVEILQEDLEITSDHLKSEHNSP